MLDSTSLDDVIGFVSDGFVGEGNESVVLREEGMAVFAVGGWGG